MIDAARNLYVRIATPTHLCHAENVRADAKIQEEGGGTGSNESRTHHSHLTRHGNAFLAVHVQRRHREYADEARGY